MKNIYLFLLGVLILASCSGKKTEVATDSKFCLSDSILHQIKLDTITLKPVLQNFKLIGKVSFNQDKVVKIYPLVSGNVAEVKVSLGDFVKKGQVLAIIRSSEMAGVQNDLTSARSNLAIAEKNFAATADMYKGGIVSEKEYTAAQKELEKAKSELSRSSSVHSIYGSGSQSDYVIKAPVSGFVVDKQITPNMQIRSDNNATLFTLSNLDDVWVLADVYESDIAGIKENQEVEITTVSYPDKIFKGKINKVYDVLDPNNKTLKVQIQLNNAEHLLKPEMFASVLVHQKLTSSMLAVPSSSIIFDKNQNWVLIYHDNCHIETRRISIASANDKYTYVHDGVKAGERVINGLQLLIYTALNQ